MRKIFCFNRIGQIFLGAIFALLGLGVVAYFGYPILQAYYQAIPAKGIDLYLTVSNVRYLANNFAGPVNAWWYQWYGGRPFESVYPVLHFYLISPLAGFFNVFRAVQIYVLASLVLFAILCYILYQYFSRNVFVSTLITLLTIFSYGQYLSLFWAGAVPYTATICLVPLVLIFIGLYVNREDIRYLYLAGITSGLGLLGHPQVIVAWALPVSSLFIFFAGTAKRRGLLDSLWFRVKDLFVYFGVTALVGFRELAFVGVEGVFRLLAGIFSGRLVGTAAEISVHPEEEMAQNFYRSRTIVAKFQETIDKVPRWISSPYFPLLLLSLSLFFISLLIVKDKKKAIRVVVLVGSLLVYGFIFGYLFFMGLNPFAGGWIRVYWGFSVLLGVVISWLAGHFLRALRAFLQERLALWNISAFSLEVLVGSLFFSVGILLLVPAVHGFTTHILTRSHEFPDKPGVLHEHAQESSAYPSLLNMKRDEWGSNGFSQVVPSWLDPNRLDYRLYDMDATVNIWWSSIFDMPLARGYLDSAGGPNYNGWQYWMNIVLNKDEIVERMGVSRELAENQARFFVDWHAIGYLEGLGGAIGRDFGIPFSSYLLDDELIEKSEEVNVWRPTHDFYIDLPAYWETLKYYKIALDNTSPIYQTTNAPAILAIGDFEAHNILMRLFGSLNLNSQKAILVQGKERVDSYSLEELRKFKMLILYRYGYRSFGRTWEMLEKYVQEGGILFVDTGDERPEADMERLPDVFPISANRREGLGREWQMEEGKVLKDWEVDVSNFTAPIFNDEAWTFSYANPEAVDEGARILLKNHGKIILVQKDLGKGQVFWSGMNLPYHALREYNPDEIKLFGKILEEGAGIGSIRPLAGTDFQRPSPQKVVIRGENAHGVLFKEAGYEGWHAYVEANGQKRKLKIYQSGPMQPGYMYVFIPPEFQNEDFTVVFTFRGAWKTWLYYFVNFLGILFALDLVTGKHGLALLAGMSLPLRNRISAWWGREDEY
ncbi:hypothetical protein B5M47_02850 [candidate division CPR3 bacterium 4484_211]|uniref:Membrane protein 6-pyruvoyl-tetrahydropterin synthase-related domain-containing protein n=1 Tax=candidate division CPR3 bacterium 4484_211 TaxID=1968527 RepID=A0A1W9NXG8_UNCC3|nr:MAG: hypothetical protein B5M47_02850 [candidate division CPR3 bacterium 4484_211]